MNPEPGTSAGLREEVREDAEAMSHTAKERLHGEVDARKGVAAEQAKSLSSALDAAADKLGPDTPNWLRTAFEQGSQTLQKLAQSVDQKDSRQLTRDVQQLARSNPGTFLAGCALAGFAAARIFKAGADAGAGAGSQAGSPSTGGTSTYQPAYQPANQPAYQPAYRPSAAQSGTPAASSDFADGTQNPAWDSHAPAGGVV